MNRNYEVIKYYGPNDLFFPSSLDLSVEVINKFDQEEKINDVNYILELYNILLIFEEDISLTKWDDEYFDTLKIKTKQFKPVIGRYFSQIKSDNIDEIYSNVCTLYKDDFWRLFDKYKTYEKIESQKFKQILVSHDISLYNILIHKKIVQCYDKELAWYMKQKGKNAKLLITHHLTEKNNSKTAYYIPRSLSLEDQLKLIESYINSEEANPNYLRLIYGSNTTNIKIPAKVRLNAKRKYNQLIDENFSEKSGIYVGTSVSFSEIDEVVKMTKLVNMKWNEYKYVYDLNWIKENLDNPTLLNNFIYLFEFTDLQFRWSFPSKESELDVIEKLAGLKGLREYKTGFQFQYKDTLSFAQMNLYCELLNSFNKPMESIIQWFFHHYLCNEFGVENFVFSDISKKAFYLEKIRTLCAELDSILRQFSVLVREGEIDRELLVFSNDQIFFEDIPSFIPNKYGYIVDSELLKISQLLFSDQSLMIVTKDNEKEYRSFVELVLDRDIRINDFNNYQQQYINYLLNKKIIFEDKFGIIRLEKNIVTVLKDFYDNEVICISYYRDNDFLNYLMSQGNIILNSSLFSKPEQDYLNFMLNNRFFDNGPAIRNKYLHGNNTNNLDEQKQDYYQLLKIIILVIIKINEEFCLRSNMKVD